MDKPLAMINHEAEPGQPLKNSYQQIRILTKQIFFVGYDILLAGKESWSTKELDPLLAPSEQKKWIDMLDRRDEKAIKDWIEAEFLTLSPPYPDPELIRIRLTSVLAQVWRYMKNHQLECPAFEAAYHEVFEQIIYSPILYQVLNKLVSFISRLFFWVG
ncbi:hypothetical protein JOC78_001018 [Bacillus ectoiniformans]|uniref:hypothetical protein n=1 Tax=Bacillus ectoiniformans TaxID=1494429 RepID=UPI001959C0F3|nr:hypothetical protein [Bacillus ectoiniformans]MBM7648078.1 hypothetical protein [Bacillus ectoiniformans]